MTAAKLNPDKPKALEVVVERKPAERRPDHPVIRVGKARAREKAAAGLRLRTSGHNCPLCAQPLPRIAGGRVAPRCASCGAHAVLDKRCAKCHRDAIWEAEARAACQACGNTGSRVMVVGGDLGRNLDK